MCWYKIYYLKYYSKYVINIYNTAIQENDPRFVYVFEFVYQALIYLIHLKNIKVNNTVTLTVKFGILLQFKNTISIY